MDDYSNLIIAENFWKTQPSVESFSQLVKGDMISHGRFRPLYYVWIVFAYNFFVNNPTQLYVWIAAFCLLTLLLWGKIIDRFFNEEHQKNYFTLYVFPLSFFVFTPFWNNFMYFSTQEKFIYLISPVSIYFFIHSYDKNKIFWLICSLFFLFLGILGKETGVALLLAYIIYAILDLIMFRFRPKLSLLVTVLGGALFLKYYYFIRGVMGGTVNYTGSYKANLGLLPILDRLMQTPFIIKMLFVFCVVWLLSYILLYFLRNFNKRNSLVILVPIFLLMYMFVLVPWKFVNYLLAPLAPMIMYMIYPVFKFFSCKNRYLKVTFQLIVVVFSFIILFLIVIPRISKMADKRKVAAAIKLIHTESSEDRYFFPPPFMESADMLGRFAGVKVIYLTGRNLNSSSLLEGALNYLIIGDQEGAVNLRDVDVKKLVYQNKTWRVFLVEEQLGVSRLFKVEFSRNFVEKLKDYLVKLK